MVSGSNGATLLTLLGTFPSLYGRLVSRAGDVDGDGTPDFVVQGGVSGQLEIHSGANGALLHSIGSPLVFPATGPTCSAFGRVFAGGEDLDGDGVPDVVIGDPLAPNNAGDPSAGRLYLFSAGQSLLTEIDLGSYSQSYLGCGFGRGLGESVIMLGDVNGDGRAKRRRRDEPDSECADELTVLHLDGASSSGSHDRSLCSLGAGLPGSRLPGRVSSLWCGRHRAHAPFLGLSNPSLFTLIDTFSFTNQLLAGLPAFGVGNGVAVAVVANGIPFPVTFTLQGLIQNASSPLGVSVTNALRLAVP